MQTGTQSGGIQCDGLVDVHGLENRYTGGRFGFMVLF